MAPRTLAASVALAAALVTSPAPLPAQPGSPAMQQAVSALTRALQEKSFDVLAPYLDDGFRLGGMSGPFARQILAQVVNGGSRAPTAVRVESAAREGDLTRVHARFAYATGDRDVALLLTSAGKFVEIPLVQVQMTGGDAPSGATVSGPVQVVMGGAPPAGAAPAPHPSNAPAAPAGPVANPALRDELLRMHDEDQRVRQALMQNGTPQAATPEQIRAMIASDSAHAARLKQILEAHGWPGRSMVGEEGSEAAWLILQHADKPTQEKYLPLVQQAVQRHELRADMGAMLEDRVLMHRGEKQRYGTQLRRNAATGRNELWPIDDEAHVDQRRAAVGLPPLAAYLASFGIEYTPPSH